MKPWESKWFPIELMRNLSKRADPPPQIWSQLVHSNWTPYQSRQRDVLKKYSTRKSSWIWAMTRRTSRATTRTRKPTSGSSCCPHRHRWSRHCWTSSWRTRAFVSFLFFCCWRRTRWWPCWQICSDSAAVVWTFWPPSSPAHSWPGRWSRKSLSSIRGH